MSKTFQNTKEKAKNLVVKAIRSVKGEEGLTTAEWIILALFISVIALGLGTLLAPVLKGMGGRIANLLNTANNQQF